MLIPIQTSMNVPTIPTTAARRMPLVQTPRGRSTVLVILDLLELDTSAKVKSYTSHLTPPSLYDVCITADHCVKIVYHEFLYTLLGSFQTSAEMLRIPPTIAMKTLFAKIPVDLRSVYVNQDSVGMDTTVQVINFLQAISVINEGSTINDLIFLLL